MLIRGGSRMIKLRHLISIFLCVFLCIIPCIQGATYNPKIYVGVLEEDYNIFIIGGEVYPLYNLHENKYIPLVYLEKMGLEKTVVNDVVYINYGDSVETAPVATLPLKDKPVSLSNQTIYIGPLRTYAIEVEGQVLVPLDALKVLWQIDVHQGAFIISHSWLKMNHFVSVNEEQIMNTSQIDLSLDLLHIFWDGKHFVDHYQMGYTLGPREAKEKYPKSLNQEGQYMTTLILQINGLPTQYQSSQLYGQKNDTIFRRYENEKRREYLTKLFPPFKIMGTMRYDVGTFKAKEKVEIWRSEKTYYYIVKDKAGKKVRIPWNSVTLDGDPGSLSPKVNAKDVEDFVSLNEIKSETDYLIWTDLYRQRTHVLKKVEDGWHLEKTFVCSTGKVNNATPTGLFKVEYSMPYFGVDKNFRCKNALVFFSSYMYHSILFDKTGTYIKSGQYDLGRKVSHGCIRLSEKDSAWLYKHIPIGTAVWIR